MIEVDLVDDSGNSFSTNMVSGKGEAGVETRTLL